MKRPFVKGEVVRLAADTLASPYRSPYDQWIPADSIGIVVSDEQMGDAATDWPTVAFNGRGVAAVQPNWLRRGGYVWKDDEE